MIYTLQYLRSHSVENNMVEIEGKWYPARPLTGTFRLERLKAAWEVFRGRADAFRWPGNQ